MLSLFSLGSEARSSTSWATNLFGSQRSVSSSPAQAVHSLRTFDIYILTAYDAGMPTRKWPMRMTLDLNEKLIRELMTVTAEKTKTEAIHQPWRK